MSTPDIHQLPQLPEMVQRLANREGEDRIDALTTAIMEIGGMLDTPADRSNWSDTGEYAATLLGVWANGRSMEELARNWVKVARTFLSPEFCPTDTPTPKTWKEAYA